MTVIAMTYETGTHGRQIATKVAASLGILLADRHYLRERLIDRLENRRLQGGCGLEEVAAFNHAHSIDDRRLARLAEEEVREHTAYGNVLLRGWGAASLLRDMAYVVRVRVWAPLDYRLQILSERNPGLSRGALLQAIAESDSCLSSNLEPVLGPVWRTDDIYHLTLNTETLTVPDAASRIEQLVVSKLKPAACDRFASVDR